MALAAAVPGTRLTSAGEIPGIPGGNSSPADKRSSRVSFTDDIRYMLMEPQFAISNYTKIYSSSIVNQLNIDIIRMIDTVIIFVSYVQD